MIKCGNYTWILIKGNKKLLLYLIVLLEGFVTISLEILTIRQLIPIAGNSIIVTSLIIGIFLLFLAYGYRKGGNYEKDYTAILKKNFILAAVGFGVGLSYIFIELFFHAIRMIMPHSTLIPLTLYLLLIIAPIVYLLGQTVPITLNLWKQSKSIGTTGGQVLHISTIGSFLGATLTALLLLNYVGVAWSIFADFVILIVLACFLMDIKKEVSSFVVILLLSVIVFWINTSFEKSFFIATNNYGNYRVVEKTSKANEQGKLLLINDSYSSYINNKKQGFEYAELIKKILFSDLKLSNKDILILGAGGFTLSAEKTQNNRFLYIDIDKQIAPIVKKHFLSQINGEFVADDARHFLTTTTKQFDVIISDAYSNHIAISPHLLTKEYFLAVNNALAKKGIAIFNMIVRPTLDDIYSKRVDNTLRSVFSNCMVIPIEYGDKPTNILYVCQKPTNMAENKVIYSDDLNNAGLDFFLAQ